MQMSDKIEGLMVQPALTSSVARVNVLDPSCKLRWDNANNRKTDLANITIVVHCPTMLQKWWRFLDNLPWKSVDDNPVCTSIPIPMPILKEEFCLHCLPATLSCKSVMMMAAWDRKEMDSMMRMTSTRLYAPQWWSKTAQQLQINCKAVEYC